MTFPKTALALSTLPVALMLAGCGDGAVDTADGGAVPTEQGLTDGSEPREGALAAQMRTRCVNQIESAGLPAGAGEEVCSCATDRAQDELSVTDLIAGDTTAIENILAQCVDEYLDLGAGEPNQAENL